jgi:hypothetical protein
MVSNNNMLKNSNKLTRNGQFNCGLKVSSLNRFSEIPKRNERIKTKARSTVGGHK